MQKAISAGGVVFRIHEGKKQIVQIIFKHAYGITFPKGHVEGNETLKETALREVAEETGLTDLRIIKKLGVVTRRSTEVDGTEVMKDIHLFLMSCDDSKSESKGEENWEWFDIDEAIEANTFPQEQEFIKKIKENIELEFIK